MLDVKLLTNCQVLLIISLTFLLKSFDGVFGMLFKIQCDWVP